MIHKNIETEVYWVVENKILGVRKPASKNEVEELKELGVNAIISLLDDTENHELYKSCEIDFLWLGIKGGGCPSLEQVDKAKLYIESKSDTGVFAVHCSGGRKRTATLIAGVLIKKGLSFKDVMAMIEKANSQVKLNDVQIDFLKNL